jgi:glycosyltransferase involved in cell wall biosynthesis
LEGFSLFSKTCSNAKLYIHSDMLGTINILDLVKTYKIEDRIYFTDSKIYKNFLTYESISKLYCMSDVYLNLSKNNSLGLCILESQFCKTPVITLNNNIACEITFTGIMTDPIKYSKCLDNISCSLSNVENINQALMKIKNGTHVLKDIDGNKYNIENNIKKWMNFLEI